MADYFDSLAQRTAGTASLTRPKLPSRFGEGRRLVSEQVSDPLAHLGAAPPP